MLLSQQVRINVPLYDKKVSVDWAITKTNFAKCYSLSHALVSLYALRLQKIVKDLNRQLQSQGSGPWPANRVALLERSLGELGRILESKVRNDLKK